MLEKNRCFSTCKKRRERILLPQSVHPSLGIPPVSSWALSRHLRMPAPNFFPGHVRERTGQGHASGTVTEAVKTPSWSRRKQFPKLKSPPQKCHPRLPPSLPVRELKTLKRDWEASLDFGGDFVMMSREIHKGMDHLDGPLCHLQKLGALVCLEATQKQGVGSLGWAGEMWPHLPLACMSESEGHHALPALHQHAWDALKERGQALPPRSLPAGSHGRQVCSGISGLEAGLWAHEGVRLGSHNRN